MLKVLGFIVALIMMILFVKFLFGLVMGIIPFLLGAPFWILIGWIAKAVHDIAKREEDVPGKGK